MIKLKDILVETKNEYFHASPHLYKKGHILNISQDTNNYVSNEPGQVNKTGRGIFITYSKYAHTTIYPIALKYKYYVYKVEPIGKLKKGSYGGEWIAESAKVLDKVGRIQKGSPLADYISDYKYVMPDQDSGQSGKYKLYLRKVKQNDQS